MIESIKVKDLAIVDEASAAFGPGLNVVTGETGAGKSVLIGAIDLASGGRADKSLIRAGASSCTVEAVFHLADTVDAVNEILADAGLSPCEDGQLIVRRVISAVGPARNFINDESTTAQTIRKVGEVTVDLHGPHDNQSLFRPEFQLRVLDSFGKLSKPFGKYSELYAQKCELQEKRLSLAGNDDAMRRELDILEYQAKEIRDAELTEADGEELETEHLNAANSEQLLELSNQASQMLTGGEPSAMDLLAQTQRAISDMIRLSPSDKDAQSWLEDARSIAVQIQELARSIDDRISGIDASPERMAALDARITLVRKLQSKYGKTICDVLAFLKSAEERIAALGSRDEAIAEIDAKLHDLEPQVKAAADELTAARKAAAKKLEKAIGKELLDLGFKSSHFEIDILPAKFGPTGADVAEFSFAPNPGEPKRALRDVASSGEIARVMLAIKTVVADHDKIPVLVFDEIDANIGGEVGNAVGEKMRQIGDKGHQALCITHLPQVAVYGTTHTVVSKSEREGRVKVTIRRVDGDERAHELARMLGGEHLTSVALTHAREMLARVSPAKA